jgi:hypothetical protein
MELYIRLLVEISVISLIMYFIVPLFNYFGSPFNGFYGYERSENPEMNTNILFTISILLGAQSIRDKVTAIINKAGFIKQITTLKSDLVSIKVSK